jgi:hypothetical protein
MDKDVVDRLDAKDVFEHDRVAIRSPPATVSQGCSTAENEIGEGTAATPPPPPPAPTEEKEDDRFKKTLEFENVCGGCIAAVVAPDDGPA